MPWYRTGSVFIMPGSSTVTGYSTNFSANARVGDAFQGPDGRWYEVTNIASATVLGIQPPYLGTPIDGGTYALAPMQGYVKDSADKLRQIVGEWGSTLAALGPLATATIAGARAALGMGSAATRNVGLASGNVMEVGAGGLLGVAPSVGAGSYMSGVQTCGFSLSSGNTDAPAAAPYAAFITIKYPEGFRTAQLAIDILSGQMYTRIVDAAGNVVPWRKSYDDSNTTRAADGTLKAI